MLIASILLMRNGHISNVNKKWNFQTLCSMNSVPRVAIEHNNRAQTNLFLSFTQMTCQNKPSTNNNNNNKR